LDDEKIRAELIQAIQDGLDPSGEAALHIGLIAIRTDFGRHVPDHGNLLPDQERNGGDPISEPSATQGASHSVFPASSHQRSIPPKLRQVDLHFHKRLCTDLVVLGADRHQKPFAPFESEDFQRLGGRVDGPKMADLVLSSCRLGQARHLRRNPTKTCDF